MIGRRTGYRVGERLAEIAAKVVAVRKHIIRASGNVVRESAAPYGARESAIAASALSGKI